MTKVTRHGTHIHTHTRLGPHPVTSGTSCSAHSHSPISVALARRGSCGLVIRYPAHQQLLPTESSHTKNSSTNHLTLRGTGNLGVQCSQGYSGFFLKYFKKLLYK